MGAKISCSGSTVTAETSVLRGIEIDARQIPDLVPILAAVASRAEGETRITGIKRLRYKESDRIATIAETAMRMGGRIETGENEMVINGVGMTKGAIIDPSNDHRIAMACSILALFSEGETIIKNAECVSKSYPSFFEDLVRMGGKVEMIK
jgi:3-phosphoshikimate 1-carboxyvinyltransferase